MKQVRQLRNLTSSCFSNPRTGRREVILAGGIAVLGLGLEQLLALRALRAEDGAPSGNSGPRARSVIFVFLSGGLSQLDSFDPKPEARSEYRGPFKPIPTRTDGLQICEHLPRLARTSDRWSVLRSLTHPYNDHSQGHQVMLTGRTELPPRFDPLQPRPDDWPSLASIATLVHRPRNNLPPAIVLPERLVHTTGRTLPGQFGGQLGAGCDPWFLEISGFDPSAYGAYPEYNFHHERGGGDRANPAFQSPQLSLPSGITLERFRRRLGVLERIGRQQQAIETAAAVEPFSRYRRMAVSLLADPRTRRAFSLEDADPRLLDRYGRNSFGWSLLLARQLVEAGVRLVQVNLGNNETWDTHVNAFHNLEHYHFPPADRALSALIEDLESRGLLDETLVVAASEFGRTPRIFSIGGGRPPGRDHWGAVQSVLLAGGGVRGGRIIGSSDRNGAYPDSDPHPPEDLAATIFQALGIPRDLEWSDPLGRPHRIYQGTPIAGLS